jgi:hypothetical protein
MPETVEIEVRGELVCAPGGEPLGIALFIGPKKVGFVWCAAFPPTNSQN